MIQRWVAFFSLLFFGSLLSYVVTLVYESSRDFFLANDMVGEYFANPYVTFLDAFIHYLPFLVPLLGGIVYIIVSELRREPDEVYRY